MNIAAKFWLYETTETGDVPIIDRAIVLSKAQTELFLKIVRLENLPLMSMSTLCGLAEDLSWRRI